MLLNPTVEFDLTEHMRTSQSGYSGITVVMEMGTKIDNDNRFRCFRIVLHVFCNEVTQYCEAEFRTCLF
jgi:hypothetical protein